MAFYVYMLKCINDGVNKTYVGYTNNVQSRLSKHNKNKGARSTRGYTWKVIYKRYFKSKSNAMTYEYKLKNDKKKRSQILKNEKNFSITPI